MPIDQRREDGLALCFDTPPLDDDLTLLGAPELDLLVSVDQPHVNLAVRLCDVYPDGTSALMTYGVLNLSHRDSHEHPTPCPVGKPFRVRLKLNDFGRNVPKGHRLRLALANQHWPILWPQPKLSTLSVASGESTVMLPVRPPSPRDRQVAFAGAGAQMPPSVLAAQHTVLLLNDSGRPIQQVFVSPAEATQWGDDLLTDRSISVGDSATVTYHGACAADLRVVFENRAAEERRGLGLCTTPAIDIRPGWTTADTVPAPPAGAPGMKP